MNFVPVPKPTLHDIHELINEAEYDSSTGLCLFCGQASSPLYNKPHLSNCKWLQTILAVEALLAKE